ncbi:Retrovirus-related Pol polyprotein from transposon TNT 1-94 [Gossypium australe]|uniref:Retrovirus-related Pol polyprotein from transposon TNT 1-94 n=1 Tax=Gossypium australe TaxID=47621 RepID=A0A5B6X0K3_9ROSI|nr:Retrovirus-related Pol polyprotein from transposon TNT 1-94 [Gossypium australe]
MEEEIESLQKNETWKLIKPPNRKKIVGYKWVFEKKEASSSDDTRYNARLVAKGYSQVEGVYFHDVFSPVVKHTSIRALLALVALYNLVLEQLDVKTAFFHGDLEEDIYMHQPDDFRIEGKEDHVCPLQKQFYVLK